MKEIIAKLVLKNLNERKLEEGDYNDILNYVETMLANQDEVARQLEDRHWKISSKFNARTVYFREIGFVNVETKYDENYKEYTLTEKRVHTYIFDGNGTKRICTKGSEKDFVEVPYNHRSFEEVMKIAADLREQAKAVLEVNEEYVLSTFKKEDLKEKSEKCYYYNDGWDTYYIPKSVVAITESGDVLLKSWYANKNREFIAEVKEEVVVEEVTTEEPEEIVAEEVKVETEATVEPETIENECAKEGNADLLNYLQDLKTSKKQIKMYELDEFISGYSQNSRYESGADLEETFIYELKNGDMLETKVSFVGGLKRLLNKIQKEGGDFDFVEEVQIKLKSYKIIKKFQKNY